MRGNTKKAAKAFNCKKFGIITGVVVIILAVLFALLYFSNKPNYRDLKKEYDRISAFIPSDWQLVSESSNKGTWGLFCLQIEGSECPYIDSQYTLDDNVSQQIDLATIKQILDQSGYYTKDQNISHCSDLDSRFYCQITAEKNNFQLQVGIGITDNGKNLRIHVGR